jgi:hypothetical protein
MNSATRPAHDSAFTREAVSEPFENLAATRTKDRKNTKGIHTTFLKRTPLRTGA